MVRDGLAAKFGRQSQVKMILQACLWVYAVVWSCQGGFEDCKRVLWLHVNVIRSNPSSYGYQCLIRKELNTRGNSDFPFNCVRAMIISPRMLACFHITQNMQSICSLASICLSILTLLVVSAVSECLLGRFDLPLNCSSWFTCQ